MAGKSNSGSSTYCNTCGYEIKWRTIDGRRTPLGCACEYGEGGIKQFWRDRAVNTTCPKCRQPVFFVRHNGGAVWFDELGEPWWKHGCFADDDGPVRKPATSNASWVLLDEFGTTDLGQKIVFVSNSAVRLQSYFPEPAFWQRKVPVRIGDKFQVHGGKFVFDDLTSCRVWKITARLCPFCKRHYLSQPREHLELCRRRRNRPAP